MGMPIFETAGAHPSTAQASSMAPSAAPAVPLPRPDHGPAVARVGDGELRAQPIPRQVARTGRLARHGRQVGVEADHAELRPSWSDAAPPVVRLVWWRATDAGGVHAFD